MTVNDGGKDGGNGEGRGHIRRRQEGREVDAGRGASNLMQQCGGAAREMAGGELFGGREAKYRSLMAVFVRCRKAESWTRTGGEVYSLCARGF
jgi:hypothetical protein